MAIRWRVDPIQLLKDCGYSTYRLRREKIIGVQTVRNIQESKSISFDTLDRICAITGKQPGKLIEYVPDPKTGKAEPSD